MKRPFSRYWISSDDSYETSYNKWFVQLNLFAARALISEGLILFLGYHAPNSIFKLVTLWYAFYLPSTFGRLGLLSV